uniref:NADH-ubiquinone oxidoreductase chain 6 n=2 Tax=Peirates TaxID=181094 RepID=A0A0C4K072_PEITU|nr:NADH dehydrogenase subunit 6 [Peirates atromaculatus]YP_009127037.1 NADH dehydrogenase subunit 6 [Peirates turpis]AHH93141.1 NADH dehydrogenase subunit 6 [Peirates atromaculatus]AHH93167.1 NADH dehydrogenase subunit 6 [Peirates turpis]
MMMFMMMMSLMMSMLFPMMSHPLSMGLILIMQTIIIAMISGMMINMFWFSYILIMTILSGMLVLFIYMASVASNEKFNSSLKTSMCMMLMFSLSIILSFFVDQLEMKKNWSPKKESIMDAEYLLTLGKMFNIHNMYIIIMMVTYLFLTMIVISYIVNVHEGPLRMKN